MFLNTAASTPARISASEMEGASSWGDFAAGPAAKQAGANTSSPMNALFIITFPSLPTSNIQHPTSNIQHLPLGRLWMFDVGCWMFAALVGMGNRWQLFGAPTAVCPHSH